MHAVQFGGCKASMEELSGQSPTPPCTPSVCNSRTCWRVRSVCWCYAPQLSSSQSHWNLLL